MSTKARGLLHIGIGILGVAGLFTGSLSAQGTLTCTTTAGSPLTVRSEGMAELIGDIVLNCTGGTPTPKGSPIPEFDIQLSVNADLTNRVFPEASALTDALLIIDEAFPTNPIPASASRPPGAPPQILCTALGGTCGEPGTGGSPSPYKTEPNVFVGVQTAVNAFFWTVPIDAPGTNGVRTIRITNVRANIAMLGGGLFSTTIEGIMAVNAPEPLTVNQPSNGTILAISQPGLLAGVNTDAGLLQCVPHNTSLMGGSGTAAFDFSVQVQEGFSSAFKFRNYGTVVYGNEFPQQLSEQNVPGFQYGTESGFYSPSLFTSVPTIGLADFGTRIRVAFHNVTAGTHLFVPVAIDTQAVNCGPPTNCSRGKLHLVKAGKYGGSVPGYEPVPATAMIGTTKVAEVSYSGTTAFAIYEVTDSNPAVTEAATIPVAVAISSSTVPAAGLATANVSLAPFSNVQTSDPTAVVPRFHDVNLGVYATAYAINSCPATPLTGKIASKSGPQNARVWSIDVDSGASYDFGATINGFTLKQTTGTACSPVVTGPSTFPLALGNIAKYGSASAPITIDFTGCPNGAQFNVQIPLSANDGSSTGSIVRTNMYR